MSARCSAVSWLVATVLAALFSGCGDDDSSAGTDAGVSRDAGGVGADAGPPGDGATPFDAGPGGIDAGARDAGDVDAATPRSGRWITAYYVGYGRTELPPAEVPYASLTHLVIGPVGPNADGTLDLTFDVDATAGPALARDLAMRAHGAGRTPMLMIGGAGYHDGFVGAASDTHRAAFVAALLAALDDLGADGLDLDWEPLDTADQPAFRALVMALRAARPSLVLTVPVGYVNSNFPDVDAAFWGSLAAQFDQINIMSYGMAGPWPGWESWHSSALDGETPTTPTSIDSSVTAWLAAGVPADKLGIGMGAYGTCWRGVTGPHQSIAGATYVADDNVMSYANIVTDYYSAASYHWDAVASTAYLSFAAPTGPSNCTFVSYDDEMGATAKGDYVRAHGLGGVIVWQVNESHVAGAPAGARDPLMAALAASVLP